MKPIKVVTLAECPQYAPILAFWSYTSWYLSRNLDFDLNVKAYQKRAHSSKIPLTMVALWGDLPVGMASLKENDLWNRKDLNPWLASVYTHEAFRRQGIASQLIEAIIQHSQTLGYEALYLFLDRHEQATLENYYQKFGFEYFEDAVDNDGFATKIMRKKLS